MSATALKRKSACAAKPVPAMSSKSFCRWRCNLEVCWHNSFSTSCPNSTRTAVTVSRACCLGPLSDRDDAVVAQVTLASLLISWIMPCQNLATSLAQIVMHCFLSLLRICKIPLASTASWLWQAWAKACSQLCPALLSVSITLIEIVLISASSFAVVTSMCKGSTPSTGINSGHRSLIASASSEAQVITEAASSLSSWLLPNLFRVAA
mmetsp:Transcript_66738/g.215059  ORF Transcript_66738/g.215059 Transcript_66738/m.215059 type:complete len:208 (-) Transcript_66738:495-1118(-)